MKQFGGKTYISTCKIHPCKNMIKSNTGEHLLHTLSWGSWLVYSILQ